MLFNILTMIVTSIICFFFFKIGFEAGKGGEINPVKLPRLPSLKRKEESEESKKVKTIMQNFENFDGTSNNQVRV